MAQVVRSAHRKTIAMELHPSGKLILRAPQYTSQAKINAYIESNYQWIIDSYKFISKEPLFVRKYAENEQFLFLGKNYSLHIAEQAKHSFEFDGVQFVISRKALPNATKHFEAFYKSRAKSIIEARVIDIANKLNIKYHNLKITSARARWGSCNNKGNVNFSWYLIMAQPSVIDYVIIHEFCHLFEFNHSSRFWALVALIMPDYKVHKKWLNDNSKFMTL